MHGHCVSHIIWPSWFRQGFDSKSTNSKSVIYNTATIRYIMLWAKNRSLVYGLPRKISYTNSTLSVKQKNRKHSESHNSRYQRLKGEKIEELIRRWKFLKNGCSFSYSCDYNYMSYNWLYSKWYHGQLLIKLVILYLISP